MEFPSVYGVFALCDPMKRSKLIEIARRYDAAVPAADGRCVPGAPLGGRVVVACCASLGAGAVFDGPAPPAAPEFAVLYELLALIEPQLDQDRISIAVRANGLVGTWAAPRSPLRRRYARIMRCDRPAPPARRSTGVPDFFPPGSTEFGTSDLCSVSLNLDRRLEPRTPVRVGNIQVIIKRRIDAGELTVPTARSAI